METNRRPDNFSEIPDGAYVSSGGWAAHFDLGEQLSVGDVFTWQDVKWEVAGEFSMPCCNLKVHLVRRPGNSLKRWSGLSCSRCKDGNTYTAEVDQ